MEPVRKNGIETKEKIFLTALSLFAEKGVDGVSLRSIIRAAEINEATVYRYFKNKDALVDSIISFFSTELEKTTPPRSAIAARAKESSPTEAFVILTSYYFDFMADTRSPLSLAHRVVFLEQLRRKEAGLALLSEQKRVKQIFITLIEELANCGKIENEKLEELARLITLQMQAISVEFLIASVHGMNREKIREDAEKILENTIEPWANPGSGRNQ